MNIFQDGIITREGEGTKEEKKAISTTRSSCTCQGVVQPPTAFKIQKKIEEDAEMFYDTEPVSSTTVDAPKNDMSESQALMITINNLIVERDK